MYNSRNIWSYYNFNKYIITYLVFIKSLYENVNNLKIVDVSTRSHGTDDLKWFIRKNKKITQPLWYSLDK